MSNELSFNHCICDTPGFCPLFNKIMTDNPPNWQWCQNCSKEERLDYLNKISKDNIKYKKIDISNLELACVGHSDKQFKTIKDRPYLKKIYLQDLNLGKWQKFQNNDYAENRIFLADNIFNETKKYIGTVTASWNIKYVNQNKIDNIENWLIYDLDEDIIVGPVLVSPIVWIQGERSIFNWLGLKKQYQDEIIKFYESNNLILIDKQVHPHNQYICKKEIYNKFVEFFRNIIVELDCLINTFDLHSLNEFARHRFHAYVAEHINMVWFANQNYKHIAMQSLNDNWYASDKIKQRNSGLYNV